MKKLLNFLILLSLISCNTKKVDYFDTNYKIVFHAALNNDKMVFLDFSTVWCGPCQYFEKKFQPDSALMIFLNKNFYTSKIDAELEYNKAIVSKYNITGYPTFIITNAKGDELSRIVGLNEKTPKEFIDLLKNTIEGREQLEQLKKGYYENPDSLNLFKKVIVDKLLDKDMYKNAKEFAISAIKVSHNEQLIQSAKFYIAYSDLKDPSLLSPQEMATFIREKSNDIWYLEYGLEQLFYFYRSSNNSDSIRFYLDKLINLKSGNHLGYVRDYARFLYENKIDIELADKLTKEYSEAEGAYADHWTPFLKVHSLAQHGDFEKGIEFFDNWMSKYSKPENFKEDYWHYKFYIDLFLFYKKGSDKAIKYAEMFESSNPTAENKKDLAELYYLNGKRSNAIKKLTEVKEMTDDPKIKSEIDELIKKYTQ
jgi:thiol-disulfide isomerase/thioredoxin